MTIDTSTDMIPTKTIKPSAAHAFHEAEAAIRALPLPVVPKSEAGWLLEREGPLYWAAGPSSRWNWQQAIIAPELWTADANKAVRFARKQDAETVIFFEGFRNVKATEHGWLLLTTTEPEQWRPIETAPTGTKLLVGYWNKLGKWRTITARYYLPNTLLTDDHVEEEFGPEGWYEESETQENISLCECQPLYWMPLPLPPTPKEPK